MRSKPRYTDALPDFLQWQMAVPGALWPQAPQHPLPGPGSNSILCLLLLLPTGHGPRPGTGQTQQDAKYPMHPTHPLPRAPLGSLLPETRFCSLHPASRTLASGNVTPHSPGREATWHGPVPATEASVLCPPELTETAQGSDAAAADSGTTWAGPGRLKRPPSPRSFI